MSIPTIAAVITAAGSSARFSKGLEGEVKKEYLPIDGHSVLYMATRPFYEIPSLKAVVVTCPKGSEDEAAVALEDLIDIASVPLLIIKGGATRMESVKAALEALKGLPGLPEYIAIHDGARPYLDKSLIITTLASAAIAGGAVPVLPVTDAVRRLGSDGLFSESIEKKGLVTVQTPQIFRSEEILDAYGRYPFTEADDDLQVHMQAGYSSTFSVGSPQNRKITFAEDIPDAKAKAEEYLKAREEGRRSAKASKRMRELIMQGDAE